MPCNCLRCGHHWLKRIEGRPAACPSCKQPRWDTVSRNAAAAPPAPDAKKGPRNGSF